MSTKELKLDDNKIRLIGVPFFGIAIPHLTNLFGELSFNDWQYWLGCVYFVGLSFSIWQGNRYLLFRTRKRFTWFDKPIEKLVLLVFNNIFYTTPLTVLWIWAWYSLAGFNEVDWQTILIVTLINVICVLFITHVYETVFMLKEQQTEQIKNEQLQRAKAEAELEALKNHIDPHFMFNSLNSLTQLINTDTSKALAFTENLAEIYRYILIQKEQSLVSVKDEMDFVNKYTELIELRFGKALSLNDVITNLQEENYYLPPVSIFVAFENIIKHNELSEKQAIYVEVGIKNDNIYIRNSRRPKKINGKPLQTGLSNLAERFKIITSKNIEINKNDEFFEVVLPLVKLQS